MMRPNWIAFIALNCLLEISQCRTTNVTSGNYDDGHLDSENAINEEPEETISDKDDEGPSVEQVQGTVGQVELFPADSHLTGQRRQPRKFLSKLHSGASFLAGLKLGKILSKKGFELGQGKIASAHTFQLFGKTVNSATSLSYGDRIPFLPALDESPESQSANDDLPKSDFPEKDLIHVTVIENPSGSTVQKLEDIVLDEVDEKKGDKGPKDDGDRINREAAETEKHVLRLYQEEEEEDKNSNAFIRDHNKLVKEINRNILRRRNSKF